MVSIDKLTEQQKTMVHTLIVELQDTTKSKTGFITSAARYSMFADKGVRGEKYPLKRTVVSVQMRYRNQIIRVNNLFFKSN